MSEANKDEVVKCMQVAKDALQNGDEDKAVRFLRKAERMGGTVCSLDELKALVGDNPTSAPSAKPAAMPHATSSSSVPRQNRVNKDGKAYSSEQMSLVQRVLRTNDYYEILQVSKDSPEEVMKKSYKQIALKLHPDKNQAPGAEEAFKKVSKAFQCLSNAQHRAAYDTYGDEEKIPRASRHYEGDFMSPEDLFNQFFGGGMQRTQYHGHHQAQEGGRNQLVQFLPFLFLIMISLLSNISSLSGGHTQQFSFKPSMAFKYERQSRNIQVSYYVGSDFTTKYPSRSSDLKQFERNVEYYYIQNVNSECDHEEKILINKMQLAKRSGRQADAEKISRIPLKSCIELDRIKKNHPKILREALTLASY